MLFLAVISLVVFAISELAARDTMLALLSSRAIALKSDFVEHTREAGAVTAAPTNDRGRKNDLEVIEVVEGLKRNIQSLSALGAQTWGTVLSLS